MGNWETRRNQSRQTKLDKVCGNGKKRMFLSYLHGILASCTHPSVGLPNLASLSVPLGLSAFFRYFFPGK